MSIVLKSLFWLLVSTDCTEYDHNDMLRYRSESDESSDVVIAKKMQRIESQKSFKDLEAQNDVHVEEKVETKKSKPPTHNAKHRLSLKQDMYYISAYQQPREHTLKSHIPKFTCDFCKKNIPNNQIIYCYDDKQYHDGCRTITVASSNSINDTSLLLASRYN